MKGNKILLLVAALALIASAALAVEVAPVVTPPAPEATTSVVASDTVQAVDAPATADTATEARDTVEVVVPVTSVVEKRHELDSRDIDYLATVPLFDGLRERVRQSLVAGVLHTPANGKWTSGDGAHSDPPYQAWTAPYQATVRIPAPRVEVKYIEKPLPPLGELQTRHTEPLRLQPVTVDLRPVGKAAPCAQPCTTSPCGGSLTISRPGGIDEHIVGSVWGTVERRPVPRVVPPPPPPTGPYCPPGGGTGITPPATPDPTVTHDPSQPGQNEPPPQDGNRPPDAGHGTGGQPWDTGPDGSHVADPVVPPAGGGT